MYEMESRMATSVEGLIKKGSYSWLNASKNCFPSNSGKV